MPDYINATEKLKQSPEQLANSRREADLINQKNKALGKKYGEQLGKDSFLKLLVTELTHQDPTQPMQDKEFIAQMAQFSSLEQMSNMSKEMKNLSSNTRSSEAYNLLGKKVQGIDPMTGKAVEGTVSHIVRDAEETYLAVDNARLRLEDIHAIFPQTTVSSPVNMQKNDQQQLSSENNVTSTVYNTGAPSSSLKIPVHESPISPKGALNSIKNYEFHYDINKRQKDAAQSYSAQ